MCAKMIVEAFTEFILAHSQVLLAFFTLDSPNRCRAEHKHQVTYQKVFFESQTITGTGTPGFFLWSIVAPTL